MKNNILLVILFGVLLNTQSRAQQFSGWLADFNTIKVGEHLSVHSDVQLRSTPQLEHAQTLLLRAGINYHLNKHFIISGGYAFVHNRRVLNDVSGYTNEHRIWEQFIFNHNIVIGGRRQSRNGTMQHRLRIEQRFLPQSTVRDNELNTTGHLYANRLRYFFRNVTPIIPWSASGAAPFFALQNEIFINVGDKSPVNGKGFDQNRLYLALGYRFNKKFDLEGGYMNQYINGAGKAFTNNHIAQLATYFRF